MTEIEATRLLNEIRSVNPSLVVGRVRFQIQTATGRVQAFDAVGKSGQRWAMRPEWFDIAGMEAKHTPGLRSWLASHGITADKER